MKILLLFSIVIFSINAQARYKIVSLYEEDALLTGRFLPFKIYNSNGELEKVSAITVSEGCYGMVDIHKDSLALVYCPEETDAKVQLLLANGDVVNTGSFEVRKLSILDSDPNPGPDPNPEPDLGRTLFANNCSNCHGATPIRQNQTVSSLKNTQFKRSSMRQFDGFFDNEQLEALATYINQEVIP